MTPLPTTAQLRSRFPDWGENERAAYRRGVASFDDEGEISGDPKNCHPCYLRGYADAMGPDTEFTAWWEAIEEDWAINHRWWEEHDDGDEESD